MEIVLEKILLLIEFFLTRFGLLGVAIIIATIVMPFVVDLDADCYSRKKAFIMLLSSLIILPIVAILFIPAMEWLRELLNPFSGTFDVFDAGKSSGFLSHWLIIITTNWFISIIPFNFVIYSLLTNWFIGFVLLTIWYIFILKYSGAGEVLKSNYDRDLKETAKYNASLKKEYEITTEYSYNAFTDNVYATSKTRDVTNYRIATPWDFVFYLILIVSMMVLPLVTIVMFVVKYLIRCFRN